MTTSPAWAIILAGGDGARLRRLTRSIAGAARPKQFCRFLGGETLIERTCRRVDLFVRFDRQVVVVSRPHEEYYRDLMGKLLPGRLVVQPRNRDTGPGIVYPLLRVADLAGDVPVVILPCDHHVSVDRAFADQVSKAVDAVHARRDLVVILGIEPSYPETDYGWIEPASVPVAAGDVDVFPIRRFWEKPPRPLARRLMMRGGLWNTFVMVGWLGTFLDLVETTAPELLVAFEPLRLVLGSRDEAATVERLYSALPAMNFSYLVLARASGYLAALPVKDLEWSDLGTPRRVVDWMRRTGDVTPSLNPTEAKR